jgi:hypothetical protein
MRRREFIVFLTGAAASPIAARAQRLEWMRRIGVVMAYAESDPNGEVQVTAFRRLLEDQAEGTQIMLTATRRGEQASFHSDRSRAIDVWLMVIEEDGFGWSQSKAREDVAKDGLLRLSHPHLRGDDGSVK